MRGIEVCEVVGDERGVEATSGVDALERWKEHREEISVLLTDIVMPGGIDGHELAIRLSAEQPSPAVITISGYDPSEVAGRSGLPQRHLRKPFTSDELLGAIAAARG